MLTEAWTESQAQAPTSEATHRQMGGSGKSDSDGETGPGELINRARSAADGGASRVA